jgi:CHAD domain-containing protein
MTYRFKVKEPIAKGVKRIALEQIEIASEKLANPADMDTAIHDARRCLKRLRALMQLLRPLLEEAVYRREAERLAGIGRLFSGARDLHVMRQTVANLERQFGPLAGGAPQRLKTLLANPTPASANTDHADGRRQALARLKQCKTFFAGGGVAGVTFDHVAQGLEHSYSKARRAFRKAYREGEDDVFHAWRKAVQQHWRHMLLVSGAWPEALSARAHAAKDLSQVLGEDHDLSVLLSFVSTHASPAVTADDRAALAALARSAQALLRTKAKPRGARLFAEPAADLTERVWQYWSSAERMAALETPLNTPKEKGAARQAGLRRLTRRGR